MEVIMRKQKIITRNREIYEKFNQLHFSKEIVLKDVKKLQVDKIVNNINKTNKVLDCETVGNYIVIKKVNPFNVNVYLK